MSREDKEIMGLVRKRRRRNSFRQKTKVNFTAVIVIIGMAVLLGYGAAKFVIYPVLNESGDSNTTESAETEKQGFQLGKFLSFFFDEENQDNNANDNTSDDNTDSTSEAENDEQNSGQQESESAPKSTENSEQQTIPNTDINVVEDMLNIKKAEETSGDVQQNGYCIQFGSFSTRLSAENLVNQLNNSGITAEIIEKDGAFKVVSRIFEQKEQAAATMNLLSGTEFTDAFITER